MLKVMCSALMGLMVLSASVASASDEKAHVDHSAFDALLKKYVVKGRVDYAGLKSEQEALKGYLKSLETVDATKYGKDEMLALYVNAYNAATLELILEYYPGIKSIKDIPLEKSWDDKRWTFCGERVSLSDLEHGVLRSQFKDPRVHFAINCGSASCPPLRSEAYSGAKIEAQLNDQAVTMNRDFGGAKFDAKTSTLHLSKIYDWYESDFTRASTLKDYVAPLASPEAAESLKKDGKVKTVFDDYDWSLNDIKK